MGFLPVEGRQQSTGDFWIDKKKIGGKLIILPSDDDLNKYLTDNSVLINSVGSWFNRKLTGYLVVDLYSCCFLGKQLLITLFISFNLDVVGG